MKKIALLPLIAILASCGFNSSTNIRKSRANDHGKVIVMHDHTDINDGMLDTTDSYVVINEEGTIFLVVVDDTNASKAYEVTGYRAVKTK